MANPSREAIAEALRQTFPGAPDKAEELAVLIAQALNNEIDATEAQARFSALSQALPGSLAGKTAAGPSALVNFGAGSSIGDLTVGDIAGGNMVKLFVGPTTFQINIGGPDKETAEPIRPRIFICHTEADNALFEQMQQKLQAAGFEVLPDPAQQNNADAQRTQFLWMGLAHAGVLLVSKNALQSTEFVTATRLLTGRYLLRVMNNDPFRLLCILLDGLQAAHLHEHNPALANLEVTFVDIPGAGAAADPALAPGATLAALQDLTESELPETVLEKLARQISDELANARPPVLKNAAQALGLRILHNESDESIRRKVSAGLWYARVEEWDRVMRELVTDTRQKVDTRRLIELVFPSWVNPCSARCLLDVAHERAARRAIVINGEMTEFVSRSFVRRAYYLSDNPKLQRPIITINTWNDTNRDAIQVIRQQIIEKLLNPLPRAEMSEEEFKRKLVRELRRGPVFVVLDPLPDRGALHKIVSAFPFPGLVFFMLSGSQPFPPDLPDALPLEPALREYEDQDAYDLYTEWQA